MAGQEEATPVKTEVRTGKSQSSAEPGSGGGEPVGRQPEQSLSHGAWSARAWECVLPSSSLALAVGKLLNP